MDGRSLGVVGEGNKKGAKIRTNNQILWEDQLITTLFQVEETINGWPLTSINDDADDLTVLTPNHFISGQYLNTQGVVDINEKDIDSRREWKVGSLSNIYWKRFIKEYISSFIVRKKME